MSEILPDHEAAVAVVIGSFNPMIFQPAWLAAQGLVSREEAESVTQGLVHPSLTAFVVGSLQVEVTPERLDVRTADVSSYVVLRDFVAGALNILEHTPVASFGINRLLHLRVASEEEWHNIGHALAPKTPWEGLVDDPGMKRVTIRGRRPGVSGATLHVGVEPSTVVHPGVYFDFNEHHQPVPGATAASFVKDGLLEHWDAAQVHFLTIAREVVARTRSGG